MQGFSASVNAILENLPRERQTMLFSATQTKNVRDLARLSLRDPTYISVHAEAVAPTPLKLQQVYWPIYQFCSNLRAAKRPCNSVDVFVQACGWRSRADVLVSCEG